MQRSAAVFSPIILVLVVLPVATAEALIASHEALVLEGDPAPDTGGGSYAAFPSAPSSQLVVDTPGVVSFAAELSGGSAASGVFQLPEPGGAVSSLAGICGLALCAARRRRGAG